VSANVVVVAATIAVVLDVRVSKASHWLPLLEVAPIRDWAWFLAFLR
jgi:hypothetical protein